MGSKMLYQSFETERSQEEIMAALGKGLMFLGGQVSKIGNNTIMVVNGKEGIQFGFAADFESTITVNPKGERKFEVICNISWKMNTLAWICLIVGIFVFGILWIVPLLYLFIDPTSSYNKAILLASNQLGTNTSIPMFF